MPLYGTSRCESLVDNDDNLAFRANNYYESCQMRAIILESLSHCQQRF